MLSTFPPAGASSGNHSDTLKHRSGSWCPMDRCTTPTDAAALAMVGDLERTLFSRCAFVSSIAPRVNASVPTTQLRTKLAGTNWCSFVFPPGLRPSDHCSDFFDAFVPESVGRSIRANVGVEFKGVSWS